LLKDLAERLVASPEPEAHFAAQLKAAG